ncbi:hypothetical protein AAMO2058_000806100 [Amorphochlora amoebiformis]
MVVDTHRLVIALFGSLLAHPLSSTTLHVDRLRMTSRPRNRRADVRRVFVTPEQMGVTDSRGEAEIRAEALAAVHELFPGFEDPSRRPMNLTTLVARRKGIRAQSVEYRNQTIFENTARFIIGRISRGVREAKLGSHFSITVFMHPGELMLASNTGHLIPLVLPKSTAESVVFGIESEHQKLRKRLSKPGTYVLYPTTDAIPVPHLANNLARGEDVHLVVIDGTWKTAKKLIRTIQRDPTLPNVRYIAIPEASGIKFDKLRKRTREDGCSTIEAVASALDILGDTKGAEGLRRGLHTLSDALTVQKGKEPVHGTYQPEEILATRQRIVAPHAKYKGSIASVVQGKFETDNQSNYNNTTRQYPGISRSWRIH